MELTLRKYECLIALAEMRSFARAADRLRISQPALSRTVALIEAHYGLRLFDRGRSGVSVTRAGEALVADARQVTELASMVDHNLRQVSAGEAGVVKIGLGPLPAGLVLKGLLATTVLERPGLTVDCIVDAADRLLPLLDTGEIDFCVVSEGFLPSDTLHSLKPIGCVPLGLFVRAAHPLARGGAVAAATEIGEWPLASGHPRFGGKLFGRFSPTIFCDDFLSLHALMLETDIVFIGGRGLVAEDLARNAVVEIALDDGWSAPVTRLVIVRRAGRTQSRAAWDTMERIAALVAAASDEDRNSSTSRRV